MRVWRAVLALLWVALSGAAAVNVFDAVREADRLGLGFSAAVLVLCIFNAKRYADELYESNSKPIRNSSTGSES